MKMKGKIITYVLLPMFFILLVSCTLGFATVRTICADVVKNGLQASAIAIKDTLYMIDETEHFRLEGDQLYKGHVNVSESTMLVDSITEKTGIVATVFYGDTRYMTSILKEDGSRLVGTQASEVVVEHVLSYKEDYFVKGIDINGSNYYAYYMPLYHTAYESGSPVGMIFTGMPEADVNKVATSIVVTIAILVAVVSTISFVVVYFSISKMTKALDASVKALDRMAEGDLATEIDRKYLKRKDELGRMFRAMINLRGVMQDVIGAIVEQSGSVHTAAQQINQSTDQTAKAIGQVDMAVGEISMGATSQASETQKATENVIIMGEMIEQTKSEVADLRDHALDMQQAGKLANQTLDELGEINRKTKKAINVIYGQTHTTNESALRIQQVTQMISEIAEETNLLSLNAAIEAARAGEQGRGFAVVASQIQKLAEQSNASTDEIASIVNELIEDSKQAVETMDDVKKIMEEQDAKVGRTGVVFGEVMSGINASIRSVEEINSRTEKLDAARANVIDIVQNLTAIAEENAASTQETSASVTEVNAIVEDIAQNAVHMNGFADKLREKVDVFKV